MKRKYTYEEAIKLESIPELSAEEYCGVIGTLIDTGLDRNEEAGIEKGLLFAQERYTQGFDDEWMGVLYYYTANGWSALYQLRNANVEETGFSLESKEKEQEIFFLRKALSLAEKIKFSGLLVQILTNLGNAMNQVGRPIEALECWRWALAIEPGFGMAVGNLGFGLTHYAKVLYDETHRFIFCRVAYVHLYKGIASPDVYPAAKRGFMEMAAMIVRRYGEDNLMAPLDLNNDFPIGISDEEKAYRQWCIKKELFLNPLNDIIHDPIVAKDSFFLPSITAYRDSPPVYLTIYNQLKQEYVSARFLFYEGVTDKVTHYSDKENRQFETGDFGVYALNVEKIKIAFRLCYSLFDKIAYLLNDYLEVGLKSHEVNFRRVWYKKGNQKAELNEKLMDSQNLALRGLYWLSKDLIASDSALSSILLPEAAKLVAIRNFVEHKSFVVVDVGESKEVQDNMTMKIRRDDLIKSTLQLMRMARSAMMYISYAIHIEESKHQEAHTFPIYMQTIDPRFKY